MFFMKRLKVSFWIPSCLALIIGFLLLACGETRSLSANTSTDSSQELPFVKPNGVHFNAEIIKAVEELAPKYGLRGYDINSVLTHDITYSNLGKVMATGGGKTMCVAAQLEVILTAINIYARETKDLSIYKFLPLRSWQRLGASDFRGHLWVNHSFNSYGAGDALENFGMGEFVPFEKLQPGGFVNFNRNNESRSGHAVVFIGFIDVKGNLLTSYSSKVIGFKYFSAQGTSAVGNGGLDFRYAIFDQFGCPAMPGKRDCQIIYSKNRKYLNTGMMWHPNLWNKTRATLAQKASSDLGETVFNKEYFNGVTTDD